MLICMYVTERITGHLELKIPNERHSYSPRTSVSQEMEMWVPIDGSGQKQLVWHFLGKYILTRSWCGQWYQLPCGKTADRAT